MSRKISNLDPPPKSPTHADEIGVNQGGTNVKLNLAQVLHDTTFIEEEHLIAYAFRNPHRFITYYNDFNVIPYWELAPGAPTTGHHHEFFGWGQGMTSGDVYIAFIGESSVNSSLSLEAQTGSGNMSILSPADRNGTGGTWLWRINDEHEFIMGAAFTWNATAGMTYRVGAAESSAEVQDLTVATTSPRFECVGAETMKFRWGVSGGVEHVLDTGITGTGQAGKTQGQEPSMHDFVVHHKAGIVRLFVDGVLTETTAPKAVGTTNEQTFIIGCGNTAGGVIATLNIDYLMIAVQRGGQLVGGPA